jgi:hypothetical protein
MKLKSKSDAPAMVKLPFIYRSYCAPERADFDDWVNEIEVPVGSGWEVYSVDVAKRVIVMRRPRQDK